jgi:hypothetical protein
MSKPPNSCHDMPPEAPDRAAVLRDQLHVVPGLLVT